MTATILYGTDFGGKKAKEQEEITSVLREIGRKAIAELDTTRPIQSNGFEISHGSPEK